MNIIRTAYAHPKARIGRVDFSGGSLAYFVGYHKCQCGETGKVLLSTDELRLLRGEIHHKRSSIGRKLASRIAKYYRLTASDLSLE